MPVVDIKIGHPVFIIEDNEIYEAKITYIINQKEAIVTSKRWFNPITKKTYGVNFFFTREKAEKVLAINIEKANIKEELQRKQKEEETRRREQEKGRALQEARKSLCNSCGTPIVSGHCACSD